MAVLSPKSVQRAVLAARNTVLNKFKLIPQDRSELVWLNILKKKAKSSASNGGVIEVQLKKNGGLKLEHYVGSDRLNHQENDIALKLTYEFKYSHMGLRVVHQELEDSGFVVLPNQARSKKFARMNSGDADLLMNLLEERVEDMDRTWDEEFDLMLLMDGSQNPKAMPGLDALLPLDPTTGLIGGKDRSNPLLQHYVKTGLTTGAGANIRVEMTRARRQAEINNGGGFGGKVDLLMVGGEFLDGYTTTSEANGLRYTRDAGKQKGVDLGIPDTAVDFEGLPMVFNPTFARLDALGYTDGTIAMEKRCYMLTMKSHEFLHLPGKLKYFSAPMDLPDRRETLMDLDARTAYALTKPNSNAIVTIA
jgi:hypothetical protein